LFFHLLFTFPSPLFYMMLDEIRQIPEISRRRMFLSRRYQEFHSLQKAMIDAGLSDAKDRAACARVSVELEYLKREMRGLPRLAAVKFDELTKRRAPKRIAAAEPIEAEQITTTADKESTSPPPTVPAPPSPTPKSSAHDVE
jgi:hypothetical protein